MRVSMKLPSKTTNKSARLTPPIPLERAERKPLEKGEYHVYKLRNVPGDDSSPVYELAVPYFDTGSCEDWLRFRDNLNKVLAGQNVTTGPMKFVVARRLLKNDALAAFENANEGENETNVTFKAALDAVTRHVFPKRAAQLQKRYMRRIVRKPADMTTKQFAARIGELNSYLPRFPPASEGGDEVSKLEDDEIVDLMEYGIPKSWQRKMIEHDFDSVSASIKDFVDFCDRMETIEAAQGGPAQQAKNSNTNKSTDRRNGEKEKSNKRRHDGGEKYCLVHGKNHTHTSNECKVLKAQADKARGSYKESENKKRRITKEQYALLEEHNLIDSDGEVRRIGPGNIPPNKKKSAIKKRKPSKQFEQELKNMEALSLSTDDEKSDGDSSDGESSSSE